VAELRPRIDELKAAGTEIAIIGSGAPNFARGFRERMQVDVPLYSDESLSAFRAASFKRGWATIFDPRVLKSIAAAFRFRQRRTMGDATQQGGTLIIRSDGEVAYHFVSRYVGDHAPVDEIVARARQAAAA
jgi:peroxiredoxin